MTDLIPFPTAHAWLVDRCDMIRHAERVPIAEAVGRRAALSVLANEGLPAVRIATLDGVAVEASRTLGASPYNPIADCDHGAVAPGEPLPSAADAVAPWDTVVEQGEGWALVSEIDAGIGVCPAGQLLAASSPAVFRQRRLSAADAALLLAMGYDGIPVFRRPRVRLLHLDDPASQWVLDQLLSPVITANGGDACTDPGTPRIGDASVDAVLLAASAEADLLLLVAGAGERHCRAARQAIRHAGHLESFGIAMRPGSLSAVGEVNGTPVLLIPGAPAAVLAAGQLLAAAAIRALAGEPAAIAASTVSAPLTRKVTSALGMTDYIRVRAGREVLEPRRMRTELDLPSLAATDGFMLVAANSEGYPAGTTVTAYLDGH